MTKLPKNSFVAVAKNHKPTVLVISGHDPSGAGITADIETCAANECFALTIVTTLTCQNTSDFSARVDSDSSFILRQLELLLQEFVPSAIKIGLIPNASMCIELASFFSSNLRNCPIILDPVLMSGGSGRPMTDKDLPSTIANKLVPLVTLLTPNKKEITVLAENENLDVATEKILDYGAGAILLTDIRNDDRPISNLLRIRKSKTRVHYLMERYPELSHGTGCTLSSAIACGLAKGHTLLKSVANGQLYTHQTVKHSLTYQSKQTLPNRFFDQ